jgi:hypothetical protein
MRNSLYLVQGMDPQNPHNAETYRRMAHRFLTYHGQQSPIPEESKLFQGAVAYMKFSHCVRWAGMDGGRAYMGPPSRRDGFGDPIMLCKLISLLYEDMLAEGRVVRASRLLLPMCRAAMAFAVPSVRVVMEASVFQRFRTQFPEVEQGALQGALHAIIEMHVEFFAAGQVLCDNPDGGAHAIYGTYFSDYAPEQTYLQGSIEALTELVMRQCRRVYPYGPRPLAALEPGSVQWREMAARGEWLETLAGIGQQLGAMEVTWVSLLECMRRVAEETPFLSERLSADGYLTHRIMEMIPHPCFNLDEAVGFPVSMEPHMYNWEADARVWHVLNWVSVWVLLGAPLLRQADFPGRVFEGGEGIEDGMASKERLLWEAKLLAMAVMWPLRRQNFWLGSMTEDVRRDVASFVNLKGWIMQWWGAEGLERQRELRVETWRRYREELEERHRPHSSIILCQHVAEERDWPVLAAMVARWEAEGVEIRRRGGRGG